MRRPDSEAGGVKLSIALFWWVIAGIIAAPAFEFLGGVVAALTSTPPTT